MHRPLTGSTHKPQTALNKRANIMYFIEHFLELAQREGHNDYVGMIQRDIIRVVDAVAPESGQGAANVKVVRRVLQGLQKKGFLEAQAVTEIEEVLKERETDLLSPVNGRQGGGDGSAAAGRAGGRGDAGTRGGEASSGGGGGDSGGRLGGDAMDIDGLPPSQTIPSRRQNGRNGTGSGDIAAAGTGGGISGGGDAAVVEPPRRLDKTQIEERIEEDRERHKRLREGIWAVPKGADAEMWRLWDETSDLGEDDHLMGEEELAERDQAVRASCAHRTEVASADPSPAATNGKVAE